MLCSFVHLIIILLFHVLTASTIFTTTDLLMYISNYVIEIWLSLWWNIGFSIRNDIWIIVIKTLSWFSYLRHITSRYTLGTFLRCLVIEFGDLRNPNVLAKVSLLTDWTSRCTLPCRVFLKLLNSNCEQFTHIA